MAATARARRNLTEGRGMSSSFSNELDVTAHLTTRPRPCATRSNVAAACYLPAAPTSRIGMVGAADPCGEGSSVIATAAIDDVVTWPGIGMVADAVPSG